MEIRVFHLKWTLTGIKWVSNGDSYEKKEKKLKNILKMLETDT